MWRPMQERDLPRAAAIAAVVHPDFPEDDAVFAERLRLYLHGCHVLMGDDTVAGYILSHPWHDGAPPALNTLLGRLPPSPPVYYIHDLALMHSARRGGAGAAIVRDLIAHARQAGFLSAALVAVNDSKSFWHRLGFRPEAPSISPATAATPAT